MNQYICHTLVDITNTNVVSYSPTQEMQRNQQRNWETVIQLLSLRTNISQITHLGYTETNLNEHFFGVMYSGVHRVWSFQFLTKNSDDFYEANDRYGTLKHDIVNTPVIINLNETAKFPTPFFFASGTHKNIYFKSV